MMGTKKYLQRLTSQGGDTIVEVLLCLTVLGLVVGTASVLATRNTTTLQTTKEDTVALRIAQGQIEYLKSYAATNWNDIASGNICMKDSKHQAPSGTGCILPDPSGGAAEYKPNITLTKVQNADDAYILAKATVTWETPKSPGKVEVTYKIYKNVTAEEDRRPGGSCGEGQIGDPGVGCAPVPPQVRAKVQKIKPASNSTTPACSSTNYENIDGVTVLLQGGNFNQVQPNSSSNSEAIFQDVNRIVPGTSYTATITGVPARYEVCNGTAQTGVLSTSGTIFPVSPVLTVRPICYQETRYTAPYEYGEWRLETVKKTGQRTVSWWQRTGPDWGPYGPAQHNRGPPNPRWGLDSNLVQWENSMFGRGLVLVKYEHAATTYDGYKWFNRSEQWSAEESYSYEVQEWVYRVIGWRSDPYQVNVCP